MMTRSSSLLTAGAMTLGLLQLMCSPDAADSKGAEPSGLSGSPAAAGSANNAAAGTPGAGGSAPGAGGGVVATAGSGPVACRPGEECKPVMIGELTPLFGPSTTLEPEILFDRGDAVITIFGDRGRDRHAREDQFQSYDHYLAHYWVHRTARYIFTDTVAKGGGTIGISWVAEWKLDVLPEFRAWYNGDGSVAQYTGNYAPHFKVEGPGKYDQDHNLVGEGEQYKYTYTIKEAFSLDKTQMPLAVGQFMEIEVSQFLSAPPEGRDNYYGTTFLYEVGKGGMVPWYTVGDFEDRDSERENSHKLDEKGWLGGRTTLPYQYTDEPDNHFMQMATNLAGENAQPFVRGRRVHHTNMYDGSHDESEENGIFTELTTLAGPNYVNNSCDACHTRNGRAPVAAIGDALDKWVFKVAAADGSKDPLLGGVLQPSLAGGGASSEGTVSIAEWTEKDGLRSPKYAFSGAQPALFSARLAPQLVGMGLLEAVDELTILGFQDIADADADGISGKAQISIDPVTGDKRLGRFGWKAGAGSLKHQIAGALNTDMGVMTSVLPEPDCGAMQENCGNDAGQELGDEYLSDLTKYVSLLGIRARRSLDDAQALRGEAVFAELGCSSCHRTEMTTSKYHPLAELRSQIIHPYTDLLLHDMGPGLADNLGEGEASGAEWRTTPLWGIGLSACVTGGVEGPFQKQVCAPHHSYLHDGRARTLEEAILWHGGEGEKSRAAFVALPEADKTALVAFLNTL